MVFVCAVIEIKEKHLSMEKEKNLQELSGHFQTP